MLKFRSKEAVAARSDRLEDVRQREIDSCTYRISGSMAQKRPPYLQLLINFFSFTLLSFILKNGGSTMRKIRRGDKAIPDFSH